MLPLPTLAHPATDDGRLMLPVVASYIDICFAVVIDAIESLVHSMAYAGPLVVVPVVDHTRVMFCRFSRFRPSR